MFKVVDFSGNENALKIDVKNKIDNLSKNQNIAINALKEIANNNKLDKLDMSELAFDALLKMNKE